MHTYKYSETTIQRKIGQQERERVKKDLSGVVSDVEEMCFEMTFERLQ